LFGSGFFLRLGLRILRCAEVKKPHSRAVVGLGG
jgi:hypothetical protein